MSDYHPTLSKLLLLWLLWLFLLNLDDSTPVVHAEVPPQHSSASSPWSWLSAETSSPSQPPSHTLSSQSLRGSFCADWSLNATTRGSLGQLHRLHLSGHPPVDAAPPYAHQVPDLHDLRGRGLDAGAPGHHQARSPCLQVAHLPHRRSASPTLEVLPQPDSLGLDACCLVRPVPVIFRIGSW